MMQNKITLIIPTRNRHENLSHSISLCLAQNYERLEVIVSDNFSSPETFEVVQQFNDKRLRYVRTPRALSMSENFDFALAHVSGGYVMMFGDDDGPVHGSLETVNQIFNQYQPLALTSAIASYAWPNHPNDSLKNCLSWGLGDKVERRDSKAWLKRTLSFEPLYTFELPGIYCGFVRHDVVTKLLKNDRFFLSQTPDAYSAFACAGAIDHYYFCQRPFVIHGASGRSNGASYLTPNADKQEAQNFIQGNNIPFHPQLVACPSFRVIAAEAFLRAKEAFPEMFEEFNVDYVKLAQNTLREINSANSAELRAAIEKIFEKNDIKISFDELRKPSRLSSPYLVDKIRRKWELLFSYNEVFSVANLDHYGIGNIQQASQALALMLDQPQGLNFKRVGRHNLLR